MSAALLLTALSIGVVHTLLGPDHYLPFIMIAKARGWSVKKTAALTLLCGAGHIAGSVILGLAGLWFGINVLNLEAFEGARGSVAAWGLIAFGLAYAVWGLRKAFAKQDAREASGKNVAAWVLFIVFALGPCEPLIPILMYPAAANGGAWQLCAVVFVFGAATLSTMLFVVLNACYGLSFISMKSAQRWINALAGLGILACGLSMQFLGL